jgi:hypothetical protein
VKFIQLVDLSEYMFLLHASKLVPVPNPWKAYIKSLERTLGPDHPMDVISSEGGARADVIRSFAKTKSTAFVSVTFT